MCALSASQLSPADMASFMINCIYQIQTALALFQYTDQRLEMLQAQVSQILNSPIMLPILFWRIFLFLHICFFHDGQIEAHLDTLISEQVSNILSYTGLATLSNTLQQYQPKDGPLAHQAGADSLAVKSAMVTKTTSVLCLKT